jgi:hypothetical protein
MPYIVLKAMEYDGRQLEPGDLLGDNKPKRSLIGMKRIKWVSEEGEPDPQAKEGDPGVDTMLQLPPPTPVEPPLPPWGPQDMPTEKQFVEHWSKVATKEQVLTDCPPGLQLDPSQDLETLLRAVHAHILSLDVPEPTEPEIDLPEPTEPEDTGLLGANGQPVRAEDSTREIETAVESATEAPAAAEDGTPSEPPASSPPVAPKGSKKTKRRRSKKKG